MNYKNTCLLLLSFFCCRVLLSQQIDLHDEVQLLEFIDADESEDEDKIKLSEIKRAFSIQFENILEFSHESGFYYDSFSIEIVSNPSTTDRIYYTLDGSIPTHESNEYIDQIFLEGPRDSLSSFNSYVIRARSFSDTIPSSRIASKSYLLFRNQNEKFSMPVISLLTDPDNLFDYDTGIYVKGVHFDPANPTWTGNYFMTGIDWERDVCIQYFTTSGEVVIDQDAGIRIHGGIQRNAAQKSLRLYAREEYGHSTFDYQLLPQKRKNKYKRFILRTSFGCWNNTVIKDPLAAQLVRGLHFETMDYRPVIVFLNGEYWGIQTIRDYLGIFHFSDKYHVDKESVNIGANDYVFEGSTADYTELDQILDNMDMAKPESLQEIARRMDINSMINYYNTEIYLNNYDWPGGNRRWWNSSEYDNGRIRWIFYDLDAAFTGRGGVTFDKLEQATVPSSGWPNPPSTTKLLSSLLKNPQFRDEFITRAAYLMNYYLHADTIIPAITRMKAEYATEMDAHLARWNSGSYASWEDNIEKALVNFARDRRNYVNQHYISKFALSGTSELTVEVNSPEMGQVYVNDMPVPEFNNKGEYFNDVQIRLTAVPKPGFNFSHWEYPIVSDFDTLAVSLSSDTLFLAVFEAGEPSEKNIRINEVMPKNSNSVWDNCFEREDWIELYNGSDEPFNLGGLYLTDDCELPFKWKISDHSNDSVILQPNGFGLFFADNETYQGIWHCGFKLNFDGETISLLKNIQGIPVILDSVTYPTLSSEDHSWGRIPDGMPVWKELSTPSPGNSNYFQTWDPKAPMRSDLHLFPNPSNYYVNVYFESDKRQSHHLVIISLSGAILKEVKFFGSMETIDISDLSPGIYILGIKEEPTVRSKLIVQ